MTFIRPGKDGRAAASIEAKASPPQVKQGRRVKVHVEVKGRPGTPSGQVTVTEGPAILGEATLNGDGRAKVGLSHDLPVNSHTLTVFSTPATTASLPPAPTSPSW